MTVAVALRLDRIGRARFDVELARLGSFRLIRAGAGTFVELAPESVAVVVLALARAGVRATPVASVPVPAPHDVPAIGLDLRPLDRDLVSVDMIDARPLPLGEATAMLLAPRGILRRITLARRDDCRALLRDADTFIAWRRVAWARPRALRRVRSVLRPVVFDRGALGRIGEGHARASEDRLGSWAFG